MDYTSDSVHGSFLRHLFLGFAVFVLCACPCVPVIQKHIFFFPRRQLFQLSHESLRGSSTEELRQHRRSFPSVATPPASEQRECRRSGLLLMSFHSACVHLTEWSTFLRPPVDAAISLEFHPSQANRPQWSKSQEEEKCLWFPFLWKQCDATSPQQKVNLTLL